jgi:multiple sugar transport system substrate-binding protein
LRTTITFACRDEEQVFYKDLIEQFESANHDIHVQLVFIDDVLNSSSEDNLRQIMSSADTLAHRISPEMTQQGLVYDLTPFIRDERDFDEKDFYPGTLEALQWAGGTWGLPAMIQSFSLIFFDKQIFDDAGVPYPQPGWTWDDFVDKAKALTAHDEDNVTRWGFVTRSWNPAPFIQGRAGLLADNSTNLLTSVLEQPAALEAVRWYTDLALVHQVMPPPERNANVLDSKTAQLIRDGRAAMWGEVTLLWDHWSAERKLGMVPFPVDGPESATTPAWVYSLVMSAGTTHPQESWRWLNFLSHQTLKGGIAIPARFQG